MAGLEQTLDSTEIADMIEKEHSKLLRDIRRYVEQFNEAKIGFVDFFKESTYVDAKGETRPCYRITKKGCEFIAHKLTGTKGTIFTARYINRFHEMENIILLQRQTGIPWFIRKFNGKYIVLERDFISITGVDIRKDKRFYREEYFEGGADFNAYGCECDKDQFKQEYGFDYGDEDCMSYFYLSGVIKAIRILERDKSIKARAGAYKMLAGETRRILDRMKKRQQSKKMFGITRQAENKASVRVNIVIGKNETVDNAPDLTP